MHRHIGARRAVAATLALVGLANVALADDAGVHAFLLNAFGQAGQVAPAAEPPRTESAGSFAPRRRIISDRAPTVRYRAESYRAAAYHPLTVRRAPPKAVAVAGPVMAPPATPAKVSIYDDPTLRQGDAVMTADGIRIFAGSHTWPYRRTDFVPIAQAHDLSVDAVKTLASLNSAPRI